MNQVRINRYNYDELMPNASIAFGSLIAAAYCPRRVGKAKENFNEIRYLYPEDIVDMMDKRLKKVHGAFETRRTKADTVKWTKIKTMAAQLIKEKVWQ